MRYLFTICLSFTYLDIRGGYSGFLETWMIEWRQKYKPGAYGLLSNPQKTPRASNKTQMDQKITPKKYHAKFPSLKNSHKVEKVRAYFIRRTKWPGYAGTTTNLQIVLNTQKIPS